MNTATQLLRGTLLRPTLRKPVFQPLWKNVHKLALWGMNIGPAGQLADSSESWVLEYCSRRLATAEKFILFDGGANVGHYTQDAMRIVGLRLEAYCFEPSPRTFAELKRNLSGANNVTLMPFGLSDESCERQLFSHVGGGAEASLVRRDMSHWGIQQDVVDTVQLRRLDDVCAAEGLSHIDLLKLDIEGHELNALRGAQSMIRNRRIRFIQFEFGAPDIESKTFFKDIFKFLSSDYRIHRVVYHGLTPIDTYSEFHETFATANFLAVVRDASECAC